MASQEFNTNPAGTKYEHQKWTIEATSIITPNGERIWEQLRSRSPAVVIVPINQEGKLGIISQNRIGANGKSHIVYEFPSGWMETNTLDVSKEQIKEEANRELQEETGYRAKQLEILSQYQLSNFTVVPFNILLATDLEENKLKGDEDEFIDVEWLTLEEAEKILLVDQTPTAQVYIALHTYKDHLR